MFSATWKRRDVSSFGRLNPNHVNMVLVTPPAVEPINLSDVKRQLRIPYNDADELLTDFITAARDTIEAYLRRSLITQTWDFIADWGPAWVELPRPPLQSIVGVFTTGLDNNEITVPTQTYFVNTNHNLVSLNIGAVWPLHRGKAGFRVRFTTGYGNSPSNVPWVIRRVIMAMVAQYDNDRLSLDVTGPQAAMLKPYRLEGLPYRMAQGLSREDLLA